VGRDGQAPGHQGQKAKQTNRTVGKPRDQSRGMAERFMSMHQSASSSNADEVWGEDRESSGVESPRRDTTAFRPQRKNGQKGSKKTHESSTDPDARLHRKRYGKESELSCLGHALVENRNGLIAAAMATHTDGYAVRDAALSMLKEKQEGRSRRITMGADKAYDSKDFVTAGGQLNITAQVTNNDQGGRGRRTREIGAPWAKSWFPGSGNGPAKHAPGSGLGPNAKKVASRALEGIFSRHRKNKFEIAAKTHFITRGPNETVSCVHFQRYPVQVCAFLPSSCCYCRPAAARGGVGAEPGSRSGIEDAFASG